MSRTVLAEVDGFTPVMDVIVEDLGLMPAVVFGRVWRYCQMKDQVCSASLEKIAAGIGVDRITVLRHIKELCEHGYLEDTTPDLRNRPHVYIDTGKAQLVLLLAGVTKSNTSKNGVAKSYPAESESDSTVTLSDSTVSESNLKIGVKKEVKKEPKKQIIINPITAQLFMDAFGQFNSPHEQERWGALYDSVGPDRAAELIAWASKKEIHLTNRPALVDALETAAKKWQTSQQRKQTAAQRGDGKAYVSGEYAEFVEW